MTRDENFALDCTRKRNDPRRTVMLSAADHHLAAGLPHIASDYMGEHRLATFAVLALESEV